MDVTYRFVLYVLLINVAYMILMLLRGGWRLYWGYIGQLLGIAAIMVVPLAAGGEVRATHLLVDVVLLVVFVLGPWWLQRQMDARMGERLYAEQLRLSRWKATLAWSAINQHQVALAEAMVMAGTDPQGALAALRRLRGCPEPCERLTRLFLATLLFDQRCFNELRHELIVEGRAWTDYPQEELFYLLRAELELGNLENALAMQLALEARNAGEARPHEMILISRLLFFAFIGARREFSALVAGFPEVFGGFPEGLLDYWRGVASVLSGEIDTGLDEMRTALAQVDVVPDGWHAQMRRRFDDFAAHRETLALVQIPRLREFRERVLPSLTEEMNRQKTSETAATEQPRKYTVTRWLIWANVGVFILLLLTDNSEDKLVLTQVGANCGQLVRDGEWYRLVTSQFLHLGWVHLLMNVLALALFGPPIERLLGAALTLAVYLSSGLVGALLSALRSTTLSVGASGAVLGLLATDLGLSLAGVTDPRSGRSGRDNIVTLAFVVGANIAIGLVEPGIDNNAHIGGLATGLVAGLVAAFVVRRPVLATGVRWLAGAAVAVLVIWAGVGLARHVAPSVRYPTPVAVAPWSRVSGAAGLSVELPPGWRIEPLKRQQGEAPQVAAVGAIGEVFEVLAAPFGDDLEAHAKVYGEQRTTLLTGDATIELKSMAGPEQVKMGGRSWFRFVWRCHMGGTPVVIKEYLGVVDGVLLFTRFSMATNHHEQYDAVVARLLAGIRAPTLASFSRLESGTGS